VKIGDLVVIHRDKGTGMPISWFPLRPQAGIIVGIVNEDPLIVTCWWLDLDIRWQHLASELKVIPPGVKTI
jgi:hypothetical protein